MISVTTDPLGFSPEQHRQLGTTSFGDLYTDARVLERERTHLFATSWSLVASTEELQEAGSFITCTIAGAPIAVVRDRDGTLRAFHNICRHRGITLLEGTGVLGRFMTCPYHQWSYALNGDLARVPQDAEQFVDLDRCALGLHGAQVAEWSGMVFVNPATGAPDLSTAMAGLDTRLDHFLSGPIRQVAKVQYEANCNWKLLVENHIDVYHLWYLHMRSLAAYEHRSFAWESLVDNWWSLEPLKDLSTSVGGFDWISEDMRGHIGAFLLFPNLMLVTTDHYFATYDATPIAPNRTRLVLRVRSTDDVDPDALVASIRSFMAEDVEACERMQDAVGSPYFDVGPLASTHEEPIRRFHGALRRRMFS
jgi:phenylpropionate dioxygenase-like ring-hydroxylating dioxygenase large terminal subunit